jgi:hypothetical protein
MLAPTELTCRELVEIVTDYLEETMSAQDRTRFELHLVYCRGCDSYVEQMRETLRLMGTLREESIDPDARDALLHTFRDWNRSSGR